MIASKDPRRAAMDKPALLTPDTYEEGLTALSRSDPDLGAIIKRLGPPPMWSREPGFPTMIRIILEQQVSLASAKAAFKRLLEAVSPLVPERFLEFDDAELKTIGFSRQKARYCRGLAQAILKGHLNLTWLETATDDEVRATLMEFKGIGPWTAEIYLLIALCRPDAWPCSDLALASALQRLKQLPELPSTSDMVLAGETWRPWRAVAARLLWHFYLNNFGE